MGVWHLPGGPPRRRRRRAPVPQLRVRRSGWHDAPLPQDPFVPLRRRSQALPGRRLVHERPRSPAFTLSPFVCYDLRFADEFWQLAHDTDVYVVPANWPAARRLHWQTLLQARAIENLAYVVGCNRVGSGGGLDYAGDSRVVDPLGELLTTAAGDERRCSPTIDPERVAQVTRALRLPRRPPLGPGTRPSAFSTARSSWSSALGNSSTDLTLRAGAGRPAGGVARVDPRDQRSAPRPLPTPHRARPAATASVRPSTYGRPLVRAASRRSSPLAPPLPQVTTTATRPSVGTGHRPERADDCNADRDADDGPVDRRAGNAVVARQP